MSSTISQPKNKSLSICVVGLSGTESDKGNVGIGKSCLCNRFVRPLADQYSSDHPSVLSNTDFGGRVVNNDHFLYWGAAKRTLADTEYTIHLVEQTEFVDDSTLQPFRAGGKSDNYLKRCLQTKLQSAEKLAYFGSCQLGLDGEYEQVLMPNGRLTVDGFICCYDVSHVAQRAIGRQAVFFVQLVQALERLKKPMVIALTKYDVANEPIVDDFHRLYQKAKLKLAVVESSAHKNVNVDETFLLCVSLLEKLTSRQKFRPTPYAEVVSSVLDREAQCLVNFERLLQQRVFDFRTTWPIVQRTLGNETAWREFVRTRGTQLAKQVFWKHEKQLKNAFLLEKQREYLRELPKIFSKLMPDLASIEHLSWRETCEQVIKPHREMNNYLVDLSRIDNGTSNTLGSYSLSSNRFGPPGAYMNGGGFATLGSTVDGNVTYDWREQVINATESPTYGDRRVSEGPIVRDVRVPFHFLNTPEAEQCFFQYKNQLRAEMKICADKTAFAQYLRDSAHLDDRIWPGHMLSNVSKLFVGMPFYDRLDEASRLDVYCHYQKRLTQQAKRDFGELLLERLDLFEEVSSAQQRLSVTVVESVHEALHDNPRYARLAKVSHLRNEAMLHVVSFLQNPYAPENCPIAKLNPTTDGQPAEDDACATWSMTNRCVDGLIERFLASLPVDGWSAAVSCSDLPTLRLLLVGRESAKIVNKCRLIYPSQMIGLSDGRPARLELRVIDGGDSYQLNDYFERYYESATAPGAFHADALLFVYATFESLQFIRDCLGYMEQSGQTVTTRACLIQVPSSAASRLPESDLAEHLSQLADEAQQLAERWQLEMTTLAANRPQQDQQLASVLMRLADGVLGRSGQQKTSSSSACPNAAGITPDLHCVVTINCGDPYAVDELLYSVVAMGRCIRTDPINQRITMELDPASMGPLSGSSHKQQAVIAELLICSVHSALTLAGQEPRYETWLLACSRRRRASVSMLRALFGTPAPSAAVSNADQLKPPVPAPPTPPGRQRRLFAIGGPDDHDGVCVADAEIVALCSVHLRCARTLLPLYSAAGATRSDLVSSEILSTKNGSLFREFILERLQPLTDGRQSSGTGNDGEGSGPLIPQPSRPSRPDQLFQMCDVGGAGQEDRQQVVSSPVSSYETMSSLESGSRSNGDVVTAGMVAGLDDETAATAAPPSPAALLNGTHQLALPLVPLTQSPPPPPPPSVLQQQQASVVLRSDRTLHLSPARCPANGRAQFRIRNGDELALRSPAPPERPARHDLAVFSSNVNGQHDYQSALLSPRPLPSVTSNRRAGSSEASYDGVGLLSDATLSSTQGSHDSLLSASSALPSHQLAAINSTAVSSGAAGTCPSLPSPVAHVYSPLLPGADYQKRTVSQPQTAGLTFRTTRDHPERRRGQVFTNQGCWPDWPVTERTSDALETAPTSWDPIFFGSRPGAGRRRLASFCNLFNLKLLASKSRKSGGSLWSRRQMPASSVDLRPKGKSACGAAGTLSSGCRRYRDWTTFSYYLSPGAASKPVWSVPTVPMSSPAAEPTGKVGQHLRLQRVTQELEQRLHSTSLAGRTELDRTTSDGAASSSVDNGGYEAETQDDYSSDADGEYSVPLDAVQVERNVYARAAQIQTIQSDRPQRKLLASSPQVPLRSAISDPVGAAGPDSGDTSSSGALQSPLVTSRFVKRTDSLSDSGSRRSESPPPNGHSTGRRLATTGPISSTMTSTVGEQNAGNSGRRSFRRRRRGSDELALLDSAGVVSSTSAEAASSSNASPATASSNAHRPKRYSRRDRWPPAGAEDDSMQRSTQSTGGALASLISRATGRSKSQHRRVETQPIPTAGAGLGRDSHVYVDYEEGPMSDSERHLPPLAPPLPERPRPKKKAPLRHSKSFGSVDAKMKLSAARAAAAASSAGSSGLAAGTGDASSAGQSQAPLWQRFKKKSLQSIDTKEKAGRKLSAGRADTTVASSGSSLTPSENARPLHEYPAFPAQMDGTLTSTQAVSLVPVFVVSCVRYIEKFGMTTQGLYRVPGNKLHSSELLERHVFDTVNEPDLAATYGGKLNVAAVSTALKQFFAEFISPPLLPEALHEPLMSALGSSASAVQAWNDDEHLAVARQVGQRLHADLDSSRVRTLLFLFGHLQRISLQSDVSMDAANLAIVWWPTLTRVDISSFEVLSRYSTVMCPVIRWMVEHVDLLAAQFVVRR